MLTGLLSELATRLFGKSFTYRKKNNGDMYIMNDKMIPKMIDGSRKTARFCWNNEKMYQSIYL